MDFAEASGGVGEGGGFRAGFLRDGEEHVGQRRMLVRIVGDVLAVLSQALPPATRSGRFFGECSPRGPLFMPDP